MNTISIIFTSDSLRLAEFNENREIIAIDEIEHHIKLDEDFSDYNSNEILISELADRISNLPSVSGKKNDKRAVVLIETSQTFLNIIPIDFSEEKNSINSQILWELSNYYPDSYKNFNVRYYRLNNIHFDSNIDEVLIIAVDKSKIEFIRKIFKECKLDVKIIDIDHFAAERCIKEIFPEHVNNNLLLIGCKHNRLDFSLITAGKLKYYDFSLINNRNINIVISKKLKFFYSYFSDIGIENVLIYGEGNLMQVKNFFDEIKKFDSDYLNPFIKFKLKGRNGTDEITSSRFAPVIGLALKS